MRFPSGNSPLVLHVFFFFFLLKVCKLRLFFCTASLYLSTQHQSFFFFFLLKLDVPPQSTAQSGSSQSFDNSLLQVMNLFFVDWSKRDSEDQHWFSLPHYRENKSLNCVLFLVFLLGTNFQELVTFLVFFMGCKKVWQPSMIRQVGQRHKKVLRHEF